MTDEIIYRAVIELNEEEAKSVLKRTNSELFKGSGEVILLRKIDDLTESILFKIGKDLMTHTINEEYKEMTKTTRKKLLARVKNCNNNNHTHSFEFSRERNLLLLECKTEGINLIAKEKEDKK